MSAFAPLMGRLSQVFSPRLCMFFSTLLMCVGSLITSLATSFSWFLVGRSFTGAGGAGILIVATILVVQVVSPKRRGLFIGLANTSMTVGLSLGAVIAGAAEPKIGWVSIFQLWEGLILTPSETSVWNPSAYQHSCRFRHPFRHPIRIQSKEQRT